LLKNYSNLWVFGDSYTTPDYCVDPCNSFWGLTAEYCKIPTIKNCSRLGNSFDSVSQLLVEMQNEYDWKKDLFLIGIPPLERITVFDNYKDTVYHGHEIDTKYWSNNPFQIKSHHGLVALQNYGEDKQLILHSDRAWLETQTLRTIFLLTSWLDSKQANYLIINLSKSLDQSNIWGPSEFVLPFVKNHERCLVFEDTYRDINVNVHKPVDYDTYGWNGHHGSDGNLYFFKKSLLPWLQRCNLA
jgi:hypothetical protein